MLIHLTAHALGGLAPLRSAAAASLAWQRLRAAFPEALAAVLLPNHLHLVTPVASLAGVQRRVGALLSGLTRSGRCGRARRVWQPVPPPARVLDHHHLRRQVRYVALNPCRARLCGDPLSWPWSTHRDVVGAVADPWVTPGKLAAALHVAVRGFTASHHAYVSADPSVDVSGTAPPRPAPIREVPAVPLEAIARAATAALRLGAAALASRPDARRVFVQLARSQGWRDARLLAARCGLHPWQVRHIARLPRPALEAALLCLGDERLAGSAPGFADPMPSGITVAR